MPSGFYILQRFFLRVDEVLFRMNDTRVYHEFGTDYLQLEYSSREEHYNKIRTVSIEILLIFYKIKIYFNHSLIY